VNEQESDFLVPRRLVAKEFGVCIRSIKNWEKAGVPSFDQPIRIRRDVYHKRANLARAKLGKVLSGKSLSIAK
jgi:hypothetical protein